MGQLNQVAAAYPEDPPAYGRMSQRSSEESSRIRY